VKSRIPWMTVLLIAALICTACDLQLNSQTDSQSVEPGAILFSDDFSNPSSGWGVWNQGGAVVEYHNEALRILVNDSQYDFWSVAGRSFSDVQIEVDSVKIAGPNDNDFGIICRYQNKDNFYMLVVSSDGYYGIAKMKDGQYSMIGADRLQYSSAIAQKEAANHLQADCVGSSLRLYANGVKLLDAQDTDFSKGDVGLIAGAYNEKGVEILFDNFTVRKPK